MPLKFEILIFAAFVVLAVNSYRLRPRKTTFDLLLPFNDPDVYYRFTDHKRSVGDDDDQRIASMVYNILYDAAEDDAINSRKTKRDAELFSGQKRQSLRKTSNFDLLAGGGLGK